MKTTLLAIAAAALALLGAPARAQHGVQDGQWPNFGGDRGNTKYSSLDQIDKGNFETLEIAWRWESSISEDVAKNNEDLRPGQFKPTPIMIDGILYLSTPFSQVVAIDAGTGETVWTFDPESYKAGRPANIGFQHRGVAYWTDGSDQRIFIATHDWKLYALNAKTGKTYPDFGEGGFADLSKGLGREVDLSQITHSSPPAICRDVVIVGSIVSDAPMRKEAPPGHVRGFDARTGRQKWVFHTIPTPGEFGNETWEQGSWQYTGAANVWSMMAADEELGYVYLPTGTSTNDFYGGHRPGNNLFAESLICLNAETGERVWHFQCIHHGTWDYDLPTAPNLIDITVDGKKIKAIAQVSKQAFTYVFDRVTGKPIWPIEERPVPQTNVPGEQTSPTQPFPTKPPAFDRQGITEDDLIDFTPELRAEALEAIDGYRLGPLFSPQMLEAESKGTIMVPSPGGGANWPGAAVDPESGILYVSSRTSAAAFKLAEPDPNRSNLRYVNKSWSAGAPRVRGLSLLKPPYSRVTAIDLNKGDHAWMTPHGEGPVNHPAIKDLNLGRLGSGDLGASLVTKTLLFVNQTGSRMARSENEGKPQIAAYDKASGEYLGSILLPDTPYGNPITYLHEGKQYIAVALGGGPFYGNGRGTTPQLVALRLP